MKSQRLEPQGTLWSTRRVASRLRVSEATVKRWADEGLIDCYRTPGGHRKFRQAVVAAFAASHDFAPGPAGLIEPPAQGDAVELMLKGDVTRLFEFSRRWIEGGSPLEALLDEVLASGLQEIGERWACGSVPVAREHFATTAVIEVLARIMPLVAAPSTRGLAVSACVAGERHDVASRMAAVLLASRKYRPLTAGADTPTDSLIEILEEHRPRVMALSASVATTDRGAVLADLRRMAAVARRTGTRLFIGGNGLPEPAPLPEGLSRVANMRALAVALQ